MMKWLVQLIKAWRSERAQDAAHKGYLRRTLEEYERAKATPAPWADNPTPPTA